MLHEATCDNYFTVKCLLKSILYNVILTQYKQAEVKTASINLTYLYFQTFDSFVFSYILLFEHFVLYSYVLYSIIFCNRLMLFVSESFIFFECLILQIFDYCWNYVPTYEVVDFTVLTFFTTNLDPMKLSQLWFVPRILLKYCINLELSNIDLPYSYTFMF